MTSFSDIELPKMHNVTELEVVTISEDIKTEEREDQNGDKYIINYILIDGKEYRIPNSVIKQVQELILKEKIKTFKVISTGTGMQTKYTIKILS